MSAASSGLCAWCREPLVNSERSTRKFCNDTCRHRFHAAKGKPPTAKAPKQCACNGSHIPGHNEDGRPTCQKCGAPISGTRIASDAARLDFFAALMEVPLYGAVRSTGAPWQSTGQRAFSTDVRVYRGEPFRPESEVEIRTALSFQRKPKAWSR